MAAGSTSTFGSYPGRSISISSDHSMAERGLLGSTMSLGMSTSTGPGRPVVAMWNASLTTRGMSCASVTRKLCLVTDMVMPVVSHSWKASVPMAARGTWPVMHTSGTESRWASQRAVTTLVAPGPLVTIMTPGLPVAWA